MPRQGRQVQLTCKGMNDKTKGEKDVKQDGSKRMNVDKNEDGNPVRKRIAHAKTKDVLLKEATESRKRAARVLAQSREKIPTIQLIEPTPSLPKRYKRSSSTRPNATMTSANYVPSSAAGETVKIAARSPPRINQDEAILHDANAFKNHQPGQVPFHSFPQCDPQSGRKGQENSSSSSQHPNSNHNEFRSNRPSSRNSSWRNTNQSRFQQSRYPYVHSTIVNNNQFHINVVNRPPRRNENWDHSRDPNPIHTMSHSLYRSFRAFQSKYTDAEMEEIDRKRKEWVQGEIDARANERKAETEAIVQKNLEAVLANLNQTPKEGQK